MTKRSASRMMALLGAGKSKYLKGKRTLRAQTAMSHPRPTVTRPHLSIQKNISAASVPARGGFTAMSIQDYARISNERSEFLNFLLAPNPSGVPVTEYGVLRAA